MRGFLALIFMKGEFQSHRHKDGRKADSFFFPKVLDLPPARDQKPVAMGCIRAVGATEVLAQGHARGSAALIPCLVGAGTQLSRCQPTLMPPPGLLRSPNTECCQEEDG